MADMNSNPISAAPLRRTRAAKTREAVPMYGSGAGVLSFRHGLPACERNAIDKALAIVGRCLREPGTVATDPDAVMQFIRLHIGAETTEVFCVMYLDAQNRAIAFEKMFTGTIAQTSVYPREVIRAALAHGATAVILAHNHPSGHLTPSKEDIGLTQTLKSGLNLVDVRVLDHVIVGKDKGLSMAMVGML